MADQDPLVLLRQSIAAKKDAVPTASSTPSSEAVPLDKATHLSFPHAAAALPLTASTRFATSEDKPVDLRSIYFAWVNRERAIPSYNADANALNESLKAGGLEGQVQNLGFIERLDLITWLEGASEESEYIKPLAGGDAGKAAEAAAATTGVAKPATAATQARAGKGTLDPRLASVYNGERRMGDRNTVLRGIKHTDFSYVHKYAAPFLKKAQSSSHPSANANLSINPKQPSRRPDPIILLSPSASALLRLSNARTLLEDGKFMPADSETSTVNMLHVQRSMRSVDPNRPLRFILVEGPEQFKPEYWNRVVAVFTTGQTWQFKNYKWSDPNELFKHTLGVYIGWKGDEPPANVRGWGHRVLSLNVERWMGEQYQASRFRDKEASEQIWRAIETNMKNKGWRKDAAPSSI